VADLRNIGRPELEYSGGSIVAALFLREFVGNAVWAHLDVAGPARSDGDEDEITKGATGFGVRTFLRLLEAATGDPGLVPRLRD
jgi:leucyl aminopeptidase